MSRLIAALVTAVCMLTLVSATETVAAGGKPTLEQTSKRGGDSLCC